MAQLEKEKNEHEEHLVQMANDFESLLSLKMADRTRKLTSKKVQVSLTQKNVCLKVMMKPGNL